MTNPPMPLGNIPFVTDWITTTKELETAPDDVSYETLALALRGDRPLPRIVRDFLADLFDKKLVKYTRGGARPKFDWFENLTVQDYIVASYRFHLHLLQEEKDGGTHLGDKPSILAVERVAEDLMDNFGEEVSVSVIIKILAKPHWTKPWDLPLADRP